MSASDLIRKYFSAYENKDRAAVEALLTNDFVFTSPYDYRIDRETYFKRCWPYGPIASSPEPMRLRRCLKETTKPSSSTTAKSRMVVDPSIPEHGILHCRRKQDKKKSRSTLVLPQKNQRK
jgi:ketosteroid isomerase-like protein